MYKNKRIGVVTAAYNEESFIEEVIKTMPMFVDRVFVVDDASTDNTPYILAMVGDSRVTVITHQKRVGAGGATIAGYKRACQEGIDVIAVMAGDGQMDPSILDRLLDPVVDGKADYSKGDRLSISHHRHGMPAWRLLGNFLLTYLIKLASGYWNVVDPQNGYTAISRYTLDRLNLDKIAKNFAFETDLLIKLNLIDAKVVNVPMPARYRDEKSKIIYFHFILSTSWIIFKDYVSRIWHKYVKFSINKLNRIKI